jgi:hypothetical protein
MLVLMFVFLTVFCLVCLHVFFCEDSIIVHLIRCLLSLSWWLFFNYHTRWVPDARLKSIGYGYEFLTVDTSMSINFHP